MSERQSREYLKQNKLMSAYYDYIGENHIDNICAEIDSLKEKIESTEVPESLDDWFSQYIKSIKKREIKNRLIGIIRKFFPRVAVSLFVLLVSLITLTFSVDALRVKVYNFLLTDHNEYSSVRIEEAAEGVTIDWEQYYFPDYIPEGFYIESAKENKDTKMISFVNSENDYILFIQSLNGSDFNIDTEDGSSRELFIGKRKGVLVDKNGEHILIWNNEECSFYIKSDLEAEKLIYIAESLKKK